MFTPRYLLNKSCFFLFFGLFCEPALTFPKTIDKPSMSMVSHKTIHSMAMVGLEKNIGKTIDTNGWNLKEGKSITRKKIPSESCQNEPSRCLSISEECYWSFNSRLSVISYNYKMIVAVLLLSASLRTSQG